MTIYDIQDKAKEISETPTSERDRIFSSIASRLFFLLLLFADFLWACYALTLLILGSMIGLLTAFKFPYFEQIITTAWRTMKRSLVCGLSLFVALFSPAFGIMIACTYFLTYDQAGIEEVVPSSLQDQFKDLMR